MTHELSTETLEHQITSLELSENELKNENRRLKLKIQRHEKNLARLTTENEAAVKERIELEDKLLSRNDQLESDIRRLENDIRQLEFQKNRYQTESQEKQAQLETCEKEKNALIKCKVFDRFTEF